MPPPRPAPITPPAPVAPSGLTATAVSSTQIDLSWTDNSNNETGFAIDRAMVSGPKPFFDSVAADVTSYSDVNVSPGETWFYSVRAFNDDGSSGVSNEASDTTPAEGDLTPDFFNFLASVIEEESYDLRARVLNPDQTINTNYVASDWSWSIVTGGSFGSIGGANSDVLTLNAASAGNSITVRATYVGSETLNPTTDDKTADIVVASAFSESLEPAGGTVIKSLNGSTLDWGSGFNPSPAWETGEPRIAVVSDANSKFGNAIEKRGFIDDTSGWLKALNVGNNIGSFREWYIRFVWLMSSNWQVHSGGNDKLFFFGARFGSESPTQFYVRYTGSNIFLVMQNVNNGSSLPVNSLIKPQGWPTVNRGVYHTLELRLRLNTAGMTDGSLRMALDGDEAATFIHPPNNTESDLSAVSWVAKDWPEPHRLTGTQQFLFWGGSGDTKTVNDFWRLSELFIKGVT